MKSITDSQVNLKFYFCELELVLVTSLSQIYFIITKLNEGKEEYFYFLQLTRIHLHFSLRIK